MIVQQGAINTTALIVPDLYVTIVPPQNLLLNGVPTNVLGVVGSASWGPVGQPIICSNSADYAKTFGPVMARKYDMGTQVVIAVQQGASNFRCVRVTDGTDVAATSTGVATCITFTALYTGSVGNGLSVAISSGSKASSWKATVTCQGLQSEVFDNVTGTGNAFWVALAAAINSGTNVLRGASELITATAGVGVTAPAAATCTFTGGTDGVATPATVATNLIGLDTIPRTGMYALRNQGVSIALLADLDASATWTVQAAFGLSEGIYMICVGPAGDTIANAVTTKATAGLDSYAVKLIFGDWVYWTDSVNGSIRLVSPQGFAAGRLAYLSPEQSSLNKQIYGVVGTQKSGLIASQATSYSNAELQALFAVGIDLICNPQPGGSYFGMRLGHNSSSDSRVNGDNYTRMTNYIAATLNAGMGKYVGEVVNASLFRRIKATQLSFLQSMLGQGLLGSTDGSLPFSVICDISNNPPARTGLGYVQSDAQIQYQAINEKFIVNMEGGQTVSVNRSSTTSAAA